MARAVAAHARIVRLDVAGPQSQRRARPASIPPSRRAPGYRWAAVGADVKALAAAGVRSRMTISTAPTWAPLRSAISAAEDGADALVPEHVRRPTPGSAAMPSDRCVICSGVSETGAAMLRASSDDDALRVFGEVVSATGAGLPERSANTRSSQYVTVHGLSHRTKLPLSAVRAAAELLAEAHLTIENMDGGGCWRTDFDAIRRAAGADADGSAESRADARPARRSARGDRRRGPSPVVTTD
jgi:hypothetical protein